MQAPPAPQGAMAPFVTRPLLVLCILLVSLTSLSVADATHRLDSSTDATPTASGYLDAVADCHADPSGASDSTAALQACFTAAYQYGVPAPGRWPAPVFFPPGVYLVSDTLNLTQANPGPQDGVNVCPGRFLSLAAFGSSASPTRPLLRLAAHSPGYAHPTQWKAVVRLWSGDPQGEGLDMNNVWRGVDVDLTQPGNPAAVGVQHAGAQGATVSDVAVTALPDTFACFAGLNGAGGTHSNLLCTGARYGVYMFDSQPVPVLVGSRFVNQSVTAIQYLSQESLSLVGVDIVTHPNATGAAIVSTGGNRGMSIVDTVIRCTGANQTAIQTPASLYMRDAYVSGCITAVAQNTVAPLAGPPTDRWLHIVEWARGTDTREYYFSNVAYLNGRREQNASLLTASLLREKDSPPSDLLSRHVWDSAAQAGVDSPGVANARTACGARGDDATDDTKALQQCLQQNRAVFLPPGRYRISATIDIPAGASLVGMGSSFSFLLAATTGFPDASDDSPAPLLRTAESDASGPPTTVAFLGLLTWHHLEHVYTLDWRTRHPLSLWRSNFDTRECECLWTSGYQRLAPTDIPCSLPWNLTIPKAVFRGLGRIHSFVNDDTGQRTCLLCMQSNKTSYCIARAHAIIRLLCLHLTGHILSTGAHYRALRVADTAAFASSTARTRFYSTNLEHGQSEAMMEVANASWVDIYSLKIEGNMPPLWVRSDASHVSLLAVGGGFTAWPSNYTYPPDFAPAIPSTLRVDAGARHVTLALLQDHGLGGGSWWPPRTSLCPWSHHYPFPGTRVPLYPYWTFPNATMWNCWWGLMVSDLYWGMVYSPQFNLTRHADKPVLWRTTDEADWQEAKAEQTQVE
ncbi:hypothetical protein MMC34_008727 [Xylographa carneopallida]|nr:hypothetical protein [Xylographa carneopallida]